MAESERARSIVRAYHNAWTSRDFGRAADLLASDLTIEVPINAYPTKDSFVQALTAFGGMVDRTDMLAEFASDDDALLLYDMHVGALGTIRIAEHFTVTGEKITRIRQIHDTAPIRAAQLG
jgi:SnoaL-like protein